MYKCHEPKNSCILQNIIVRLDRQDIRETLKPPRGGGGRTPYNGLYGEAPPERGTFFRLQVYERVGISQVEVYEHGYLSLDIICLVAHSFPRASLSENCSLLGTDNVRGQISEHIFAPNGGYCLFSKFSAPTYCISSFLIG